MPSLSVIIPTYNRPRVLEKCLAALAVQTLDRDRFEVLVCDDGSDQSQEHIGRGSGLDVFYIRQERLGPAAARNKGVRAARGETLLFMNDDALAHEGLLETHLETHLEIGRSLGNGHAVLGGFDLMPEHAATPLGHLLATTGALFGYHGLTPGGPHDYDYFYTCNVSLSREAVLAAGLFDERFKGPAAEDIDLGYRLQKMGTRVHYEPRCKAGHDHAVTLDGFCKVCEMRGHWAVEFFLKHPDAPRGVLRNGDPEVLRQEQRDDRRQAMKNLRQRLANPLSQTRPAPEERARVANEHAGDFAALQRHHYLLGLLGNPRFDEALAAVRRAMEGEGGAL